MSEYELGIHDSSTNLNRHRQNDYPNTRTDQKDDSPGVFDAFILANFKPYSSGDNVVEINVPSDEELDPVVSTQSHLVQTHLVSKSSHRSPAAKYKRNKKRHEQQKQKYKDHPLRRQVHCSWSISQIKNFLFKSNIPFGCVNPRRGTMVTILFSNEEQRQYANAHLSDDVFDEFHHTEWTIDHPQK